VLDAELVEHGDDRPAQALLVVALGGGELLEQDVERGLGLAGVELRERVSSSMRAARPSAAKLPVTLRRRSSAASPSPASWCRRARPKFAATFAGSVSMTLRSDASSPASSSSWVCDGTRPSKNASTCAGDCAPTNSATTSPLRKAFTAGMPWTPKRSEIPGFSSVSIFAKTTSPSRLAAAFSSTGPSWRHGAHHGAQKSTTTGTPAERATTSASKSASLTSITVMDTG
jgi:hypothetical protein